MKIADLRHANVEHSEKAARIAASTGFNSLSEQIQDKHFGNGWEYLAAIDTESQVFGVALVEPSNFHNLCRIQELAIDPSHQRQGLGTIFIKEIVRHKLSGKPGSHEVQVTISPNPTKGLLDFYLKLGFEPESDDRFYRATCQAILDN